MIVYPWREAPEANFAVIGNPITHSKSPLMHGAAYEALGIEATYVAVEVPEEECGEALTHLASLGYQGVNVTIPNKEAAFAWCETVTPTAERIGVVNTIRFSDRHGINTDVPGFTKALETLPLVGKRALVLGAGGSSRAVLLALESLGMEIDLWNRTSGRAISLVQDFGFKCSVVEKPKLEGIDLIVNATAASLDDSSLLLPWKHVESGCVAMDLAYGKEETRFVLEAAEFGVIAIDGRRMLMEQGAVAFEFWLDRPAPRDVMLAALTESDA